MQGRERGRLKPQDEARENAPPNKNLFIVNYDPDATTGEDLEAYFSKWGEIEKVQMKDKYSFVEVHQFNSWLINGNSMPVCHIIDSIVFANL